MIETVNPVNGVVLQRYAAMSPDDIEVDAPRRAAAAARAWGRGAGRRATAGAAQARQRAA